MKRPMTGYRRDEQDGWVAELDCGHYQHLRHRPPFFNRPWVISRTGRDAMLGREPNCVKCDRGEPVDRR